MSRLRNLPTVLKTYLANRKLRTGFFVDLLFETGWIYLTTYARDVFVPSTGNTYLRAKTLIYNGTPQNLALRNTEGSVSLSGIPMDYKALVLKQEYTGNPLIARQGFFDFVTDQLIVDPLIVDQGPVTSMQFVDDIASGTSTISLPFASVFSKFNDNNGMRTNPSQHENLFPGDRIFNQVPNLANKEILIGRL